MEKNKLLKRLSELETINDQLITEFNYLNELMKQIGFEQGLQGLKLAAEEIVQEQSR